MSGGFKFAIMRDGERHVFTMGRVSFAMLERLHQSPDGRAGFRRHSGEVSQSAVRHGWVKLEHYSGMKGRVDWYEITPEGREAFEAARQYVPA